MALEYIPITFTEEEFFGRILKKSSAYGSVVAAESHVKKFKLFCLDKYKTEASLFCRQLAADYRETQNPMKVLRVLQDFIDWCQVDHLHLFYYVGYKKQQKKPVTKIHNNTIHGVFSCIKKYMVQVGGIRVDNRDIVMQVVLPPKIETDDEDAEPITYEMGKEIISYLRRHPLAITLFHGMNSTAFRLSEMLQTQEKNVDFSKNPPTIYLEKQKSKAKKSKGYRYMLPECASRIKLLMAGDPENYIFLSKIDSKQMQDANFTPKEKERLLHKYESKENRKFRRACVVLDQGRAKPLYTAKYEENNRYKINLHSWRKRCGSEYAKANNKDLSHGYLRHKDDLSMYMLNTEDERILAFRKAAPLLALDKDEKIKVELKAKEQELDELKAEKEENAGLYELLKDPKLVRVLKDLTNKQ